MASARHGAALRHIRHLFDEGTLAGLPDARLLERYVGHRDELAFQALVQRHGAMVMAVCRGVLTDPNDVDDAFQAAFLLLARKARSIWIEGSIGGWLHRVAWRIALQVKTDATRHRRQERKAAELASPRETSSPSWDDAGAVLHQEIDRLPERYRKPIVLCYLEDMTYQQAAGALRWSEGTTRGRLARGKALLRDRLTRSGITLAAASMGGEAIAGTASAASMALTQATVTGRLVDAHGHPRANVELEMLFRPAATEGRFRVECLVPGREYFGEQSGLGPAIHLDLFEPGETRDLENVRLQANTP
ncbi:MAG: RNA polymerase sigma factor [Isosphaeraceae bacterium]